MRKLICKLFWMFIESCAVEIRQYIGWGKGIMRFFKT
jgi:hypothetical protein